jgi:hypothetical protein
MSSWYVNEALVAQRTASAARVGGEAALRPSTPVGIGGTSATARSRWRSGRAWVRTTRLAAIR